MIDPSKDKLKSHYAIDAEHEGINTALLDKLIDGTPVDIMSEIYISDDGTRYAIVTSKESLPNPNIVKSELKNYSNPEEYDVDDDYQLLNPTSPLDGFLVFKLIPR